ncbi:MAG: hypothetical protein ACI9ZT_001954 [Gammaproteobacteria bacterium]
MKKVFNWLLIIIGMWALISAIGYFIVGYINNGGIYLDAEIPTIAQLIISIIAISYGIKEIRREKNGEVKT